MTAIISNWESECPECPWCPGDVTGDGIVDLDDLLLVISNYESTCDPCGESASSMMMGSSSLPPLADVLEEWGFEDWNEAVAWMAEASAEDVAAFLEALTDG